MYKPVLSSMALSLINIIIFSCFIEFAVSSDQDTVWKDILQQYRRWDGNYNYKSEVYPCTLLIHSVQKGTDGGMYATFRDKNTVMEVDGYSATEEECIDIRKVTTFNESDIFPKEDDFRAKLCLKHTKDMWTLFGNITEPNKKDFGYMYLDAKASASKVEVFDDGKEGMRIGLAVGIPVTLAVILSIVAVSMIVWAVKKGYLRHVPRNYKNFNNNKMVEFSNSETESTTATNPTVHI
ncbi:hypothetical protein LOTGIDRAFT_229959 [Lottia gigantea]|uniref:Uncharacterized protein n=1 Tax=Lottia gigantea TaxID=225164 RepID=V4AL24_LOTGI|nr:hypothetical protein LOTGIDRAFT_229959 [Lottia gigantea]ESP04869.1 hypothetical protein LOTGIDRAFT_229959 [Lottia gigantea]